MLEEETALNHNIPVEKNEKILYSSMELCLYYCRYFPQLSVLFVIFVYTSQLNHWLMQSAGCQTIVSSFYYGIRVSMGSEFNVQLLWEWIILSSDHVISKAVHKLHGSTFVYLDTIFIILYNLCVRPMHVPLPPPPPPFSGACTLVQIIHKGMSAWETVQSCHRYSELGYSAHVPI